MAPTNEKTPIQSDERLQKIEQGIVLIQKCFPNGVERIPNFVPLGYDEPEVIEVNRADHPVLDASGLYAALYAVRAIRPEVRANPDMCAQNFYDENTRRGVDAGYLTRGHVGLPDRTTLQGINYLIWRTQHPLGKPAMKPELKAYHISDMNTLHWALAMGFTAVAQDDIEERFFALVGMKQKGPDAAWIIWGSPQNLPTTIMDAGDTSSELLNSRQTLQLSVLPADIVTSLKHVTVLVGTEPQIEELQRSPLDNLKVS